MKKLLILCLLLLEGCASWSVITGAAITPQATLVAINAFDALEIAATGYSRLSPCVVGGSIVCRNAAAMATIVPSIMTGRVARDQLMALLQANQGNNIPVATFDTLQAIIQTLQAEYAQFNIHPQYRQRYYRSF